MAQTSQADSAEQTPSITLLHAVDSIDSIAYRIAFIMNGINQSDDWIDPEAANSLYFTLESIWQDLKAQNNAIDLARKGVQP